jgi:hypothetical protein
VLGTGVSVASKTLTNAQIKALPTTPVEILPAPGVGLALVPLFALVQCNAAAGAFTNIQGTALVRFLLGTAAEFPLARMRETNGDVSRLLATAAVAAMALCPFTPGVDAVSAVVRLKSDWENLALQFDATNAASGDFTGGNAANTLTIAVYFVTVAI